jgi:predicted enzyme related to lactoylglutathione lyase
MEGKEKTAPRLYRVILPVRDIDAAAKFYAAVFEVPGERVSPGRHYFQCGDVILAVYDPTPDGDAMDEGWRFHENQYIYFAVPDLEAIRSRITAAGGKLLTEIEDMPWGERIFYAEDPQGCRLSFVDERTLFEGNQ